MGDDLVGRRCAVRRQVLGRVGIGDQRRVVAAGDRAVQRRADARVGLRARDEERPMPRAASTDSRSVSSKESPYAFCTSGSDSRRTSSGTYCQPHCPGQFVAVVLDPDDIDAGGARLVDQGGDIRDDAVAVVRLRHDAVLHVDDEQRGVRPVLERGHGASRHVRIRGPDHAMPWLRHSGRRTVARPAAARARPHRPWRTGLVGAAEDEPLAVGGRPAAPDAGRCSGWPSAGMTRGVADVAALMSSSHSGWPQCNTRAQPVATAAANSSQVSTVTVR